MVLKVVPVLHGENKVVSTDHNGRAHKMRNEGRHHCGWFK